MSLVLGYLGKTISNNSQKGLSKIYLCFLPFLLIITRKLELVVKPRMWAEEATVHLHESFESTILEMLFFIPHWEGYFCFNRNLVIVILKLFPIEYAAIITTWAGFLIQLIPHLIIICSDQKIWGNNLRKLLLSTAIIIIPIGTGETWLNTTCSHYHLGVLSFIILLDAIELKTNWKKYVYSIILFVCALSSPVGCFMLIGYTYGGLFLKLAISKTIYATYTLAVCIQLAISIYFLNSSDGLANTRFNNFFLPELPSIFINDVIVSSLSGQNGLYQFVRVINSLSNLTNLSTTLIYSVIFFTTLLILIFKTRNKSIDKVTALIVVSFLTTYLLFYFSSASKTNLLPRNALLPGIILISFLILKSNLKCFWHLIMYCIFFFVSSYEFLKFDSVYFSDDWPTWSDEIEKRRGNKEYKVKVWPRKNSHWYFLTDDDWSIKIPDNEL